jgi:glutathione S-transferase/RNA polymerase-associated protein
MLKLYENPLSPLAQKVKIALYEKGLDFRCDVPDLLIGTPEQEFARVSLRREVPTLVDGDVSIFDSTIILEYIEERWPDPALLPRGPAARARAREIEELCDTYFEAINWGVTEIRVFGRAKGDLADQLIAHAGQQIKGLYAYFERQLGDAPFFGGEAFGWGDLSVYPHVVGAAAQGVLPTPGSKLAAWFARAKDRPSTQKALSPAKKMLQSLPDLAAMVDSGALVRQYRDHRLEWMIRSGGLSIVLDGIAKKTIRFSTELA